LFNGGKYAILRETFEPMMDGWTKTGWTSAALLAGLFGLLLIILSDLGVAPAERRDREVPSPEMSRSLPLDTMSKLFSPERLQAILPLTNEPAPFYTDHFVPPRVSPPPPAKTKQARKLELVYLGFYQNAEGARHAFVQVGDELFVGPAGSQLENHFTIQEIGLNSVTLINGAEESYLLYFNSKKTIEIPSN
jgi:hypothetical protein